MEGYKVTILDCSKELTARERIMLKDTGNAVKLDEAVSKEGSLTIEPQFYAILSIHNEKSENPDYQNYVIVGADGTKYITGSPSFWSSFSEIWEEMVQEDESYRICVYKMDSKNYKGKQFLTCSIL